MKKLTLLTLTLVLTALAQLTAPPVQAEVSVPDANLAAAIREALELPPGAAITSDAMLNLTRLAALGRGIADLTGLEDAVNLTELDLSNARDAGKLHQNPISNLLPLASLTNLVSLNLGYTDVSDVSSLAGLTNLKSLNLSWTDVSDVSSLAGLTNLETLDLNGTDISDVSSLASLTNLETLSLSATAVSDVSSLAGLTNLETLSLSATAVSDVSSLAGLTNLKSLDLIRTGVDISSLAGLTNLETLSLHDTGVSDVSSLAGLTNLKSLSLHDTGVSDVSSLASLTNLEWLGLWDTAVSDISALAHLTQLKWLDLNSTGVSDVSSLAGLTNLESLYLWDTGVSDVSALASLTNLEGLHLDDTAVSDVSALAHLTNLEWLSLNSTGVSDASSLASLTNLESLQLINTAVSDVSPLLGLSLFRRVRLLGCPLSYASIHTHIPALQAKGIKVDFDNVAHPALLKVSGDRQEGEPGATLKTPFVVAAMDEHGKPIGGKTVGFSVLEGEGTLSAKMVETDAQGNARVTFTLGSSHGVNKVKASSEGIQSWVLFTAVGTEEAPQLVADVNGDGVVNVQDLKFVAAQFGQMGEDIPADVNGDGIVNIQDLVLVAGAFGGAGAPAAQAGAREVLVAADVAGWVAQAQALVLTTPAYQRGLVVLEQLLASLKQEATVLLANYPNPFNPETWIPYQLATAAEVTVTIHASDGKLVRTLELGQRPAGIYQTKGRAAYWDGRNALNEPVASGVYFYTLTAGDFKATRKMLIRK